MKYLKEYLLRGLLFSGFGPIIYGIIVLIINQKMTPKEIFLGIISTYIIAFVHAGSSIFPQIEKLPKVGALFIELFSLYITYTFFYLINGWLKFKLSIFLIYTTIFIGGFLLIWLIIFILTKREVKKLNQSLNKN